MKKFVSLLMAFALAVLCFGTYSVAHLSCEDDCTAHDHTHDLVVKADDEPDEPIVPEEYLYINKRTTTYAYSEQTKTLRLTIYVESESTEKGTSGRLIIAIPYNQALSSQPRVRTANVFGLSASSADIFTPTSMTASAMSTITFEVDPASNYEFTQSAFVEIECTVNTENAAQFYWLRTAGIRVDGEVVTKSGKLVEFASGGDLYTAYLCNHAVTTYQITTEPTCLKAGEKKLVCSSCSYVIRTETMLPTNHNFDFSKAFNTYLEPEVKPTCSKNGSGYYKCLDCNSIMFATVPKLEHKFGDRYIKNGLYYVKCTVCQTEQQASNQCPHDLDAYNLLLVIESSTCTKAGSARYQCPTCKQVEERALPLADHKLGTPTVTKAATCLTSGSQTRTCSACREMIAETIPATGHSYGDWYNVTEATCISMGKQARTCATCGNIETKNVQGTGHSYGQWITTTEPTCISAGVSSRTCTLCGDKQTQPITASGHKFGSYSTTIAPTCVANGEETRYCTVCNFADKRIVAPNSENHKYGEWVTVSNKTCIADGEKTRTCVYCANVERDVVASTGHTFGEPVADGKITTKSCVSCGYKESVEILKDGSTKKTLTVNSVASLVLMGADAGKNYTFEIRTLAENEADMIQYRQYFVGTLGNAFLNAYRFRILCDGVEVPVNANMSIVINTHIEGRELAVSKLFQNGFYGISESDIDDGDITVEGVDIIGTNTLFVERGEEIKTNLLIPIVVTVATLLVAGAAIYFFVVKGNKKQQF